MRRLKNPLVAGGLTALVVCLLLAAYRLGWDVPLVSSTLEVLERNTLDWRFDLRGPQAPGGEVVVLGFDDRTIREDPGLFERRDGWVRVFEALARQRAKVVGVDALFVDAEHILPAGLKADLDAYFARRASPGDGEPDEAEALLARVHHETLADERLAQVLGRLGNVVLAFHLGSTGGWSNEDPSLAKAAYGQAVPGDLPPPEGKQVLASLPAFNAAARGLGVISVSEDASHAVRQVVAVRRYRGAYMAPMAVALVAAYLEVPKERRIYLGQGARGLPRIQLGSRTLDLNLDHGMWLNYRGGPQTFATYSVIDLVQGKLPPGALADKIVLLGFTYFGHDRARTPYSGDLPGVEVHATAVDNLLAGDALVRVAWWIDVLICLGFAGLLVLLYWPRLRLGPLARAGGSLVLLVGTLGAGHWLFVQAQVWVNWIGPLVLFFTVSLVCLALSFLGEEVARRRVRAAFAHYLSDDVIEQLLVRPGALKLGGERRELSVLFSDIRGFTSLSEGLDPEVLTELLNAYLTPMTRVVLDNRGLLDKYIGDAIMAVYGAPVPDPDHAQAACVSALQMFAELDRLAPVFAQRGWPALQIGVGINTGPMSVGNMGSADRFDYTVVGDHVNLGSRLEGLTKLYGVAYIASGSTRQAVGDAFTFRQLDRVAVKGKQEPVALFELVHLGPADPDADAWIADFEQALQAYRDQRFKQAQQAFEALVDARADGPATLFAKRCEEMLAAPPGADWDGVFRAMSK